MLFLLSTPNHIYTVIVCVGCQMYRNRMIAKFVDIVYALCCMARKWLWNIRCLRENHTWSSLSYLSPETNIWGQSYYSYDEVFYYPWAELDSYIVDAKYNNYAHFGQRAFAQRGLQQLVDGMIRPIKSCALFKDNILIASQLSPYQCMYKMSNTMSMPNTDNLVLVPSLVRFFAVEYTHPCMSKSLPLTMSVSACMVGNQLLSRVFVKRALEYEYGNYAIFDEHYTVVVMDDKVNLVTLQWNQFLEITLESYIIREI